LLRGAARRGGGRVTATRCSWQRPRACALQALCRSLALPGMQPPMQAAAVHAGAAGSSHAPALRAHPFERLGSEERSPPGAPRAAAGRGHLRPAAAAGRGTALPVGGCAARGLHWVPGRLRKLTSVKKAALSVCAHNGRFVKGRGLQTGVGVWWVVQW
jgi:hypothetical protein